MIAIGVWLAALWRDWQTAPSWSRRLIGGVVVSALIVGGLALWYHRGVGRAYAAGKAAGIDSVQVAALKTATAQHDSIVALHDALGKADSAAAARAIADARKTAAALDSVRHPVPDLPATIDSSGWAKLRTELATELRTKDSLLYQVAVPKIRQLADSADHLLAAYTREHADRLHADSLAHAWKAKALEHHDPSPAPHESRMKAIAKAVVFAGLGFLAAKHIR